MRRVFFRKALSVLLCLCYMLSMMMPLSYLFTLSGSAATESDQETSTESIYLDGVHYHIEKSISYIGNRSFQMNVELHTSLTETDVAIEHAYSRNGYFTVEVSGYYLLELWGGDGANGGNASNPLSLMPGGKGGKGGYVYAKVYLEAGQTLAYSIGTDGVQTHALNDGGGANGTGGDHGAQGSFAVGGGGGYSALYFFDEGEFDPSWLTSSRRWDMPGSVRLSHYVMIAAGGGGGGAGNGTAFSNATGTNGIKLANGGAGGSITNGASMQLSAAAGYTVPGYLYFGKNGQSSGTSTAYIGRAGTNVPGASPSTWLNEFTAKPGPNDWTGMYNEDVAAGAGGSGMFRGGGGGAGYCGGSGGIMTSSILASNVGGGGGGSSFLAASMGGNPVDVSGVETERLHGVDGCTSEEGGAFSYTFLGGEENVEIDTEYLRSVSVQGSFSKYFDVYAGPSNDGTLDGDGVPNANGTLEYDEESGTFTVTDANIDPSSTIKNGVLLSMSFYVRPKTGFAGGNNVPLLESLSLSMDRNSSEATVIEAKEQATTDFVNVPLYLPVSTNSKMISLVEGEEPPTFAIADLYNADYADAINNISAAGWAYDFISYVSAYRVYKGNQGAVGSTYTKTITDPITETTHFSITISVTAKADSGYAACGPQNTVSQTFYGVATITVVSATVFDGEEWNYDLTAKKTLSHDGSYYLFEQAVTQSFTAPYEIERNYANKTAETFESSEFEAEVPGYYLVQVWGANGGRGGSATARAGSRTSFTRSGGSGGAGGALFGFVYLMPGDKVTFLVGGVGSAGQNGTDTQPSSAAAARGTGGKGGYYSYAKLKRAGQETDEYLMIAGGGGGGGGAGAAQADATGNTYGSAGGTGSSANSTPVTWLPEDGLDDFFGSSGTAGYADRGYDWWFPDASGRAGGSAGVNYVNAELLNKGLDDAETVYMERLAELLAGSLARPTTGGGAAQVTYICDDPTTDRIEGFPGVEAGGTFSRYFDVASDEGEYLVDMTITGVGYDQRVVEPDEDGYTKISYYSEGLLVCSFRYSITPKGELTEYHVTETVYYPTFRLDPNQANTYIADCGFSIVFSLVPKEGFLGGNDVPVLAGVGEQYSNVWVARGETVGYLLSEDKADYANVAVDYDVASHFFVEEGYVVQKDGDTSNDSVSTDDLYTLTIDLSEYAEWQKEFVKIQYPETKEIKPVNSNETVTLTAGIVPKEEAKKAAVIGGEVGALVSLTTTVYIQYPVTYNLSHMTHSGEELITRGKPFTVRITAEEGFLQPPLYDPVTGEANITVKSGSSNVTFSYDQENGEIVISDLHISNAVTITASAIPMPYTIHYMYSLDGVANEEYTESYQAGATIDFGWLNAFDAPAKEGYSFTWEWETEDGRQPTTMPGHDVWALGAYRKNTYPLHIEYVDQEDNEIAPPYEAQVEYGAAYSVVSPIPEYWLPDGALSNGAAVDPFAVSGVMGDERVDVTVTYRYANNQLVILYLYPDGSEIPDTRVNVTLSEGATYQHLSPDVVGYIPDSATVNGEEWEDPTQIAGTIVGTQNVVAQVVYRAKTYAVMLEYQYADNTYPDDQRDDASSLSYDFSGAVLDFGEDTITVQYNNIWGYNAATDNYGLPTPVAEGYEFAGWYTDTSFGDSARITEDMVVSLTEAITLYAKWIPRQYKHIMRYPIVHGQYHAFDASVLPAGAVVVDDDNDGVVDYYYTETLRYMGSQFVTSIPMAEGYTAYRYYGIPGEQVSMNGQSIETLMPAMNVVYEITYAINVYTIRFRIKSGTEQVEYPSYTQVREEDAFAAERLLCENTYEHGQEVVYPDDSSVLVHPIYTYKVDHWTDAEGQPYALGFTAWQDMDCYAYYVAYENIAEVYSSTSATEPLSYHCDLQEAMDVAMAAKATGTGSAYMVRLRRNDDVVGSERDVVLTAPVVLEGESNHYVYLDLNGINLRSDATVLDIRRATVYLHSSDMETPVTITTHSEQDAVTIRLADNSRLYYGESGLIDGVSICAVSDSGDAIGVRATDNSYLYQYGGAVSAQAPVGSAYGVYMDLSGTPSQSIYYQYLYGSVSATAQDVAVAVRTNGSIYLCGNKLTLTASSANGDAVAVEATNHVRFSGTPGAVIQATSVNGDAVGIRTTNTLYANTSASGVSNRVEARSATGNACGVDANRLDYGTNTYLNVAAQADNGVATGMRIQTANGVMILARTTEIAAVGKEAVALQCNYELQLYAQLVAQGTDRAVALNNSAKTTLYEGASVSAESETGTAYAVESGQLAAYTAAITATVSASTDSGHAYALYNTDLTSSSANLLVEATARSGSAYGFGVGEGKSHSLPTDAVIHVTATEGTAYGAHIHGEAQLAGQLLVNGTTAYGVYNTGKVSAISADLSVNATQNAYGVANMGGQVYGAADGFAVNAHTVSGTSYGLYNDGGTIGTESADLAIGNGVITATADEGSEGYALYAQSGTIYIRGLNLYYKGSSDDRRSYGNVQICVGYVELRKEDTDVQYPGYYYLAVDGEFYLVFVETDVEGNEITTYVPMEYTPGIGFVGNAVPPTAVNHAGEGYEASWESYDFTAGVLGEDGKYYKYVKTAYARKEFTVYFYANDDNNTSYTATFLYLDPIVFPDLTDLTKYGYVPNGTWYGYENGNYTTYAEGSTMPAQDMSIYANWDNGVYTVTLMTGGIDFTVEGVEVIEQTEDKIVLRGKYNTYYSVSYIYPAYTLEGWYTDPALTNRVYGDYIRGEDVVLYPKWSESLSVIIMGEFKAYTVMLNVKMDTNGDGVEETIKLATLEELMGEDQPLFREGELGQCDVSMPWILSLLPEDMLSQMGLPERYRIVGWYSADDRPINLASGIGSWGIAPVNGLINVYARLEPLENASSWKDLLVEQQMIEGGQEIEGEYYPLVTFGMTAAAQDGAQGGYAYHTYKSLFDGTHTIKIAPVGDGYSTHLQATVYSPDGTRRVVYDNTMVQGGLSFKDLEALQVEMKVGDTLVFRSHQVDTGGGVGDAAFLYLFQFPPGEGLMANPDYMEIRLMTSLMMHNAMDFTFYGPSSGDFVLPMPDNTTNPAYQKVQGWRWMQHDNTLSSQRIPNNTVVPEMLQDMSMWLDMDGMALLWLIPDVPYEWTDQWMGAVAAGRHFSLDVFGDDLETSVTVRPNGAVTFAFGTEDTRVGYEATLHFANGLSAGAALSLVDCSGKHPVYYYYIVSAADVADGPLKSLPLTSFVRSGGTEHFKGCSSLMLFNLSYAQAAEMPAQEQISIDIDGNESSVQLSCQWYDTRQEDAGDRTQMSAVPLTETLTIPSLTNRGYDDNDTAVLVIRLLDEQGKAVPLPAGFLVQPQSGTIHTYGDYAYASLGRVKNFASAVPMVGSMYLDTLRYHGYTGTIVYDIMVVPEGTSLSGGSFMGANTVLDTRLSVGLTLEETPAVTLEEKSATVSKSEAFDVVVSVEGQAPEQALPITMHVYRQKNGKMVYTDACSRLLFTEDGTSVDISDGKVQDELLTGTHSFTVSEEAETGVYYLVVYYYDRYAVYTLTVTE